MFTFSSCLSSCQLGPWHVLASVYSCFDNQCHKKLRLVLWSDHNDQMEILCSAYYIIIIIIPCWRDNDGHWRLIDPARLDLFSLLSQLIIWNSGRLECSRLDPEQRLCALSNLCTVYCALYCFVGSPIFPFPWAVVSAIRSVSGKITQLSHSSALHFESCFAHSLQ